MNFKAKVKVENVLHLDAGNPAISVTMRPVTEDSEENKTFSKYTPSGNLSLYITNPNLFDIKVGDVYYVNFTKE